MTVIWAGKELTRGEEERVRNIVSMFARLAADGDRDAMWQADSWRRFLPEHGHMWTSEELRFGWQLGRSMTLGLDLADGSPGQSWADWVSEERSRAPDDLTSEEIAALARRR